MTRKSLGSAWLLLSSAAFCSAQMAVHAVTGSIKAVTPHSIVVALGDGPPSEFTIDTSSKTRLAFDSDLRNEASAPANFQKVGDFALIYYYGYDTQRTAVAVKDLGAGPFTKTQGTVVAFDKHTRALTLKDAAGKQTSLVLDDHLIIDTDMGVNSGRKFTPHKGEQVRVTYSAGTPATVAFLGESL